MIRAPSNAGVDVKDDELIQIMDDVEELFGNQIFKTHGCDDLLQTDKL